MATKKSLIQQIRGNALSINQIAAELSASDEPLAYNFVQTQKEKFKMLTGSTRGKRKTDIPTGKLASFKKADLEKILKQQEKFLKSRLITEEGRSEIFKKQYETFLKNRPGAKNISENTLLEIQKFFMSDLRIYEELTENSQYNSEQIVNLVMQGYSADEIVHALQKIDASNIKNSIARGKWKSFIKAVLKEPDTEVEKIAEAYSKKTRRTKN